MEGSTRVYWGIKLKGGVAVRKAIKDDMVFPFDQAFEFLKKHQHLEEELSLSVF
jgi:hypothetical protein